MRDYDYDLFSRPNVAIYIVIGLLTAWCVSSLARLPWKYWLCAIFLNVVVCCCASLTAFVLCMSLGWAGAAMPLFMCLACLASDYIFVRNGIRETRDREALEGGLEARLQDGTIRLLSVPSLRARECRIVRNQELPQGALLPPEKAVEALRKSSVAALSYRWLSSLEPDPDGFHARALSMALGTADEPMLIGDRYISAIFIDYCSLPQKAPAAGSGRTEAEQDQFRTSLEVVANLYASPRVTVLQHKRLPRKMVVDGATPYDLSGWCQFEQGVASLTTTRDKLRVVKHGKLVEATDEQQLRGAALEERLEDESLTVFHGRADRAKVTGLYRAFRATAAAFDRDNTPLLVRVAQHNLASRARLLCFLVVLTLCTTVVAVGMFLIPTIEPTTSEGVMLLVFAHLAPPVSFALFLCSLCISPALTRHRVRRLWRESSQGAIAPALGEQSPVLPSLERCESRANFLVAATMSTWTLDDHQGNGRVPGSARSPSGRRYRAK